jgi:tetratricopeptide (TPR) repeat protein
MRKNHLVMLLSSAVTFVTASPVSAQALSIAGPLKNGEHAKNPTEKVGETKVEQSPVKMQEGKIETMDFVLNSSPWEKYYRNGLTALEERRLAQAENMLIKSLKEAKNVGSEAHSLTLSRLALGQLYLKQSRFAEAHNIYLSTMPKTQIEYGLRSVERAECLYGLAYTEYQSNKEKEAKEHIETAINILKGLDKTDTQLYGLSLHTLGLVMAKHGWTEDAKPLFTESRKIVEHHAGNKKLDLAEMLREQSLFFHGLGDRHTAHSLYEQSYQIKEKAVIGSQPPSIVGELRFPWEPGSSRAQEIIDNDFPFRYMSAHGIRVACTVVDLWELLAILVTVTNVGDKQEEFELGPIKLERLSNDLGRNTQEIPIVDHQRIDRIGKERNIWDLTHTRPWLANIQKTRNVRGLVPPNGHDLFMGPNVFGVYGEWKAISHTVPERVGVLPSREGLVAENTDVALPGLVRPSRAKLAGLTPVWLEPFESRTGEQFYINPRDADILIKVPIGNAIFEFPFHTRKIKIPRSI